MGIEKTQQRTQALYDCRPDAMSDSWQSDGERTMAMIEHNKPSR